MLWWIAPSERSWNDEKTLTSKAILLNTPHILMGLFATNFGEAWRMALRGGCFRKASFAGCGSAWALQSFWPSLHPLDLLVGLCCGVDLRLAVYLKRQNAKKYPSRFGVWLLCPLGNL